jgi:hypothetical protein
MPGTKEKKKDKRARQEANKKKQISKGRSGRRKGGGKVKHRPSRGKSDI